MVDKILNASEFKKCLTLQNEINKEILAYTEYKDVCYAKWEAEEAQKAAIASAQAAAEAEAAAAAALAAFETANNDDRFFGE